MKRETAPKVIVVGGGIAGLCAAKTLASKGISVLVVEAADTVGGRMATVELDGHVMDTGAQFLSSAYKQIQKLSAEAEPAIQWQRVRGSASIIGLDNIKTFGAGSALELLRSGILEPRPWLRLLWQGMQTPGLVRRTLSDYSAWSDLDNELTLDWAQRCIGTAAARQFFDPILQGFYFQSANETSRSLMSAVLSFAARRATVQTLERGMQSLPIALANDLEVRTNCSVTAVRKSILGFDVHTETELLTADAVVVAVPATIAKNLVEHLISDLDGLALLATTYASTITVGLSVDRAFSLPHALSQSYGILFSLDARTEIAAISVEAYKRAEVSSDTQLFNLMLTDTAARRYMHEADEEIVSVALRAVTSHLPDLHKYIRATHVARWPYAEPRSPVGRAQHLANYRRSSSDHSPGVILAGDYMSMPFTEGAAESGHWAATLLLRDLGPNKH